MFQGVQEHFPSFIRLLVVMCPVDCIAPFAVVVKVIGVLPPSRISLSLIVRAIAVVNHFFDILGHSRRALVVAVGFVVEVESKVDECGKERKR